MKKEDRPITEQEA